MTVRDAHPGDIAAILEMGQDPAFAVSRRIRFYERAELHDWMTRSEEDNLLLVVEDATGTVVGFCFCKIMSCHWALLDNFYVRPAHRGYRLGALLFRALLTRLRALDIAYVSTCIAPAQQPALVHALSRAGFQLAQPYDWYELHLDASPRTAE